jgi:hypothetical protein
MKIKKMKTPSLILYKLQVSILNGVFDGFILNSVTNQRLELLYRFSFNVPFSELDYPLRVRNAESAFRTTCTIKPEKSIFCENKYMQTISS